MHWTTVCLLIVTVSRSTVGQYQVTREDPFAQLSSTLVTKQAAACDGEFAHLRCPIGSKISIQFVQYDRSSNLSVCPADLHHPGAPGPGQSCRVGESVREVEDLCQGKETCTVHAGFSVLGGSRGDRCKGIRRHLEILYKCKPASFRSRVVCGGDKLTLSCPKAEHRLAILSSAFASASKGHIYCPIHGYQQDEDPASLSFQTPPSIELIKCEQTSVTPRLIDECHGQSKCNLLADPTILKVPECVDLHIYMKTTYACVDLSVFLPRYLLNSTQRLRYDSTSSTEKVTSTTSSTTTTTATTTTTSTTRTTTMRGASLSSTGVPVYREFDKHIDRWRDSAQYDESSYLREEDDIVDERAKEHPTYSIESRLLEPTRVRQSSAEEGGFPVLTVASGMINDISFIKKHKIEIILCFVLSSVLGISVFLIIVLVRHFRTRPTSAHQPPSTTDLDTIDCDPDMEIVPLPEPQFLSSPETKYPTLGRGSKILRNSDYNTPSPARDNVVRYSTIGRQQRISPGSGSAAQQVIYAPGSTYSAASNHSSYLDSDLANPRSLTLSTRTDLPLYD